jgi:hypothetical protein
MLYEWITDWGVVGEIWWWYGILELVLWLLSSRVRMLRPSHQCHGRWVLGHKGSALMNGTCGLVQEAPLNCLPLPMRGYTETLMCVSQKAALARHHICQCLGLGLSSLWKCVKWITGVTSHSYGNLQLEWTRRWCSIDKRPYFRRCRQKFPWSATTSAIRFIMAGESCALPNSLCAWGSWGGYGKVIMGESTWRATVMFVLNMAIDLRCSQVKKLKRKWVQGRVGEVLGRDELGKN